MRPPKTLSDEDLLDYADHHLKYEIDMLVWTSAILGFLAAKRGQGYLPWAINNGLLNSYALHARNLVNFLYSGSENRDHKTDIIMDDYVDSAILSTHLPPISPLLNQARKKSNKQVAHLSMDRIAYEESGKEWRFIELSRKILETFSTIAPFIPSTRISDSLREQLTRDEFRIPLIEIDIGESANNEPISVTFSLRISEDGKEVQGVSA